MHRSVFLILLILSAAGCIGTKSGAYRVFAEDLVRLQGVQFNQAYVYNIGYIAKLDPENTKELSNGNRILVFSIKPPRNQDCSVHIEIDKNGMVVSATSEGPECWRSY